MAALDLSYDSDNSDPDERASSDTSVDDFTDEVARHFFNDFSENSDEEEEFAGFHFEMPDEVEWAVLGQPKRSADQSQNPVPDLAPRLIYKLK